MRVSHFNFQSVFLQVLALISLGSVAPLHSQNQALREISFQVSEKTSGRVVDNLTSSDFELLVNAKKRKIESIKRERRNLSIVVVVVTSPSSPCLDESSSHLYLMGRILIEVLGPADDVAVVLTNQNGSVQRPFGSARHTLETDLSLAEKAARENSFQSGMDEYGNPTSESGSVYPLSGLERAVGLLKERPVTDDRLVLFVRQMENTNAGEGDRSRKLLDELFRNGISVGWIGSTAKERSGTPQFGDRNFFLALSTRTGGFFQPCRESVTLMSLFESSRKANVDGYSELRSYVDRSANRYRLTFDHLSDLETAKTVSIGITNKVLKRSLSVNFPKQIY